MTCLACHVPSSVEDIEASIEVNSDIGEYYIPGELFYFSINVIAEGFYDFGFQACFENAQGEKVGEILLFDSLQTHLISDGEYITHMPYGTSGVGSKLWGFYW